ncbi:MULTISPECIES: hypothetical protein [Clostridium]|uniref:hypothetical protein n=1 Tax=Clostridium TaxID=1485 RepID=UPI0032EFB6C9
MGLYRPHPLNTANSRPILQLDKESGAFIAEYPSISEAGRAGFNRGNINKVLASKRKSANGFTWVYKYN